MTKYIFILLIIITGFAGLVFGQTIENVRFRQTEDDKVVISYNIAGGEGQTFEVSLSVSDDGGQNYLIIPRTVSGDVGKNVKGGRSKTITWDVLSDIRRLEGNSFVFKVTAKSAGGLTIAGIEWVFIKGGTFEMGDTFGDGYDREKPVHTVTVNDFYLGKYEVTFAQYDAFCKATGRSKPKDKGWGRGSRPVINVSWHDAAAYCEWLTKKAGTKIRLPTEAEWEYAARSGGKKEKWAGTNSSGTLGDYAWFESNSGGKTHPVGTKRPNALGLYDMSGNVWEWCADWYDSDYYKSSPRNNRQGPSAGTHRVLRGGGWTGDPHNLRCSGRLYGPVFRSHSVGFRILRTR